MFLIISFDFFFNLLNVIHKQLHLNSLLLRQDFKKYWFSFTMQFYIEFNQFENLMCLLQKSFYCIIKLIIRKKI